MRARCPVRSKAPFWQSAGHFRSTPRSRQFESRWHFAFVPTSDIASRSPPTEYRERIAARRRLFNSNLMIVDQAAINASPTSVSRTLSLAGPGEIPFVNSVTLSGTAQTPTFSWSPPPGVPVDGYRINIYQNGLEVIAAHSAIFKVAPSLTGL
jgi:hypothetical protein